MGIRDGDNDGDNIVSHILSADHLLQVSPWQMHSLTIKDVGATLVKKDTYLNLDYV